MAGRPRFGPFAGSAARASHPCGNVTCLQHPPASYFFLHSQDQGGGTGRMGGPWRPGVGPSLCFLSKRLAVSCEVSRVISVNSSRQGDPSKATKRHTRQAQPPRSSPPSKRCRGERKAVAGWLSNAMRIPTLASAHRQGEEGVSWRRLRFPGGAGASGSSAGAVWVGDWRPACLA